MKRLIGPVIGLTLNSMEMPIDSAAVLRRAGLRVTPQRLAVLDYLSATDSHPTAEDVSRVVNRSASAVSRASIYNVLHSLCRSGLVREVVAGNAITRYDANLQPHHHFVCRLCGRVGDIPWEDAKLALPDRPEPAHIDAYEVVFHGRCGSCASA